MKTSKTIQMYTDPGHGWAKVKKTELAKLGIENKITSFSFMRGEYAYLEEDCDLTTYCNALRAAGVTDIKFREASYADNESRIRYYDLYECPNGISYKYEFTAEAA